MEYSVIIWEERIGSKTTREATLYIMNKNDDFCHDIQNEINNIPRVERVCCAAKR